MICITINGEPKSLDPVSGQALTIEVLLASIETPPNYLAVEQNGEVVPRERHGDVLVRDGDEIELVTLVGGG
ncbi:MAG: sulfur carrier protein ThiS [Planctomycetota bacterium]